MLGKAKEWEIEKWMTDASTAFSPRKKEVDRRLLYMELKGSFLEKLRTISLSEMSEMPLDV
jgi:hypothetical protein